jgi:ribosome-binding protein aMBF1 (putative translation factor)
MTSRKLCAWMLLVLLLVAGDASAQRKTKKKPAPKKEPPSELTKLREEYVKATNEYKASLEKLVAIYEANVKKAEEKVTLSKKLLAEGLIARTQVEENEHALALEKQKVEETRRQMTNADAQIAGVLVETAADEEIAKNLRFAKQTLIRTSAFTRYTGSGGWSLSDAGTIQRFFSDTFHKQLPIAVFGQGAIHDRWRLDHRNAMDIQLHPDGVEGRALLDYLQRNGIPYSAFRSAIPGTATGPHIHIGRPSHRY